MFAFFKVFSSIHHLGLLGLLHISEKNHIFVFCGFTFLPLIQCIKNYIFILLMPNLDIKYAMSQNSQTVCMFYIQNSIASSSVMTQEYLKGPYTLALPMQRDRQSRQVTWPLSRKQFHSIKPPVFIFRFMRQPSDKNEGKNLRLGCSIFGYTKPLIFANLHTWPQIYLV